MDTAAIETVGDLLRHELFKDAEVIAGNAGLNNPVKWIHILEVTTASFANRHDFILTTGLGIKERTTDRTAYVQELIERGVAGICIELGQYMQAVPEDMKALADRCGFPIAVFRKEVRFVDITQHINGMFINRQHQMLVNLEAYSRTLQQLSLETTDIGPMLRQLHRQTSLQVVYCALTESHRAYPPLPPHIRHKRLAQYKTALDASAEAARQPAALPLDDSAFILSQPVICLGQTLSHIGLVLERDRPSDTYALLLDYTSKAIAQVLLRKLFLEEKQLENQAKIIDDLLQGRLTSEEQALARIGAPASAKRKRVFVAGLFELESEAAPAEGDRWEAVRQDVFVLLRAILKKNNVQSLQLLKNNHMMVVCVFTYPQDETDEFAAAKKVLLEIREQLHSRIRADSTAPFRIRSGFGSPRTKLTALTRGFQECFDVLSVQRLNPASSPFYNELGVDRLLQAIPDPAVIDAFVRDQLGRVLAYDRRHRSNLIETLDAYLACLGSVQDTARRLFIHRQTLYHRLNKLTELLGDGFMRQDKRLCLEMALHAYRNQAKRETDS